MHAKLQRVEVEALRCRDDDLAVEDAAGRQQPLEGVVQLGEVAIERAQIAALDEHARRAAKHDGAKAVPLRFVQEFTAGRQRLDGLREHRGNRRLYCETVESGHQGLVSPATAPDCRRGLDYRRETLRLRSGCDSPSPASASAQLANDPASPPLPVRAA